MCWYQLSINEKCHRDKGKKWFREGRVWGALCQSSMFSFITTHVCSWPLSCKCPLPFSAGLRWLSGLCFIKPHWGLFASHALHPPNSIYSPVTAEPKKCYCEGCSHVCPPEAQNWLHNPGMHYLRGSVLVVPYPLLHQPHQGCNVVKLSLFQHPWWGTQSTDSVTLHRIEWRWFCHKDSNLLLTPNLAQMSESQMCHPPPALRLGENAWLAVTFFCDLRGSLRKIIPLSLGLEIRNLMVQCPFLHPAPSKESPQSCLFGKNHGLWGADGLHQTLGSAQWQGVLWAAASALGKTQNLMT